MEFLNLSSSSLGMGVVWKLGQWNCGSGVYSPARMIFVNPVAGGGRGASLARGLQRWGVASHELELLPSVQALTRRLAELRDQEERVFIIGGDGTVRLAAEVLRGSDTALGVIPAGTGNGFARSLGITDDSDATIRHLLQAGRRRRVDVGSAGGRVFCSVCGWGFAALVAASAPKVLFLRGTVPFFFGILRQLPAWGRSGVEVEVPGWGTLGPFATVLVQNTPFTGGGMRLAPAADLQDGKLDLLLVDPVPRARLLRHLLAILSGRHLLQPFFHYYQVEEVVVKSERSAISTLDGEVLMESPQGAHVVPGALWVVVPGERND